MRCDPFLAHAGALVPEPWLARLHDPPGHAPAITNETGETRPWK
ncbi:MAG: hypothetical protein ACUVSD_04310 [Thiobacillaceae bacterium]